MLMVISPAKTLDFESPSPLSKSTKPALLKQAGSLIEQLKPLSPDELSSLMGISQKLGELNHSRFQNWQVPFTKANAKQAIYAFQGDVYTGFEAASLTEKQMEFAQQHLRILSGLYGVLRPLDLMQPYRLEMGTKFKNTGGKNLYEFWGDTLTKAINRQAKAIEANVVINLASQEYFSALSKSDIKPRIITPIFKDLKNGKYKIVSFFAKKARGRMAAYIVQKGLKQPSALKRYTVDGYRYDEASSTETEWVFLRDEPSA